MAQSSSDSSQAEYSHEATVAAIASYYELLARVHPDSVSSLEYPPPEGWPQITPESFSILGRNDTVIELMRHIPYFTSDRISFMKSTTPRNFADASFCRRIHEESRVYNEEVWPVPQDKIGANPGYSPEGGEVPIPTSMFTLAVLAEEKEEGYDILLDTEHNIVIVVRVGEEFPHGWPPNNGEDSEDSEEDVDLYLLGHDWRYSPTYRIDTFFKMCQEQWRVVNWIPKMEWAGQIEERYRSAETKLDETYGDGLRQKIMREAGWPGAGEEVGLGWDKAKAEKQMIELM
ncbi:hypothetical protein HER10_EVM0004723 [Colletotrichum scovillei]|uniref:uncharacterized protein n=1 Tax=Colletotrichum scovillei TaxID=1209932 RepID=UPI0015C33F95|nr:uncharacterized protein HER10_EVM0004723 [Colletotrichum scovillei]KAF4784144.1 hypothetical protein HER10_EVM0004723 [Colletotrichum scovillei]